jgi:hypothetical protein
MMAFQANTSVEQSLEVHKHFQNGVEGYRFIIGSTPFFLPEREADTLARYLLFGESEEEEKFVTEDNKSQAEVNEQPEPKDSAPVQVESAEQHLQETLPHNPEGEDQ